MSKEKGYISEAMRAGRIGSFGKITSLATAFKLEGEVPFSILIVPKADVTAGVITKTTDTSGLEVNCITTQNDTAAKYPVYFHEETLLAITEIAIDAIDLDVYDVYWNCGSRGKVPA
jgi:hypothetical protein